MGQKILNYDNEELIKEHFAELSIEFPFLELRKNSTGFWVISGDLSFTASYKETTINDTFSILIEIPHDYPNSPPVVQETGGRIPPDFHQYNNRNLCLAAPVEILIRFKKDQRLLIFVKTLVIEYLYAYSYFEKYGVLPFGELSHGCKGILEYYENYFNTSDINIIVKFFILLINNNYRGHHICKCNSGKILRRCHGPSLLELLNSINKEQLLYDFTLILYNLSKSKIKEIVDDLPETIIDYIKKNWIKPK